MYNENEQFNSADEQRVSQLLGRLKYVDAPKDFNFRVKARIAAGKPAEALGFRMPVAVRYAVPLVLLLAVGTYFGINALYSPKTGDIQVIVAESPGKTTPPLELQEKDKVVLPPPVLNEEQAGIKPVDSVNVLPRTGDQRLPAKKTSSEKGNGSYDQSLGTANPIVPKALNPNHKASGRPQDFDRSLSLPAKEVFSQIGINADYTASGWKVNGVTQYSLAERSGLKAGDVVEAIDDQSVDEKLVFKGGFTGKSVRVLRDGKRIEIELKPR